MVIAVPIGPDGQVGGAWGRAASVAIAHVAEGSVSSWTEHEVGWDAAHDQGGEGEHHARVVRFLREHDVTDIVAHHMGPGMARTVAAMGLRVHTPLDADAREAAQLLAASA